MSKKLGEAAGMTGGSHTPGADVEEDELSLRPYLETLWSYRRFMGAAMLAVLFLFVVFATWAYVSLPSERLASVQFRLLFEGADKGQYPNQTKFSPSEIVATPVLTEVFRANDLQRFGSFGDFKDSLFIQQANPDIDLLSAEYQAKLADTRLTPVDRSRLEEEFRRKREALTDPRYALSLRRTERFRATPRSLLEKVLNDTLSVWAKQADERKGATKYDIPTFSDTVLDKAAIENEDYLIGVDMLRAKARRVIDNIDKIVKLPGANVIRTSKDHISLAEVRANLEDVVRFKLEPLIGVVLSESLSKNPKLLGLYAQGQLLQIRLSREEAAGRVKALQDSLADYMAQRASRSFAETRPGGGGAGAERGPAGAGSSSVIPQLGESFLDRVLALSADTQKTDITYRQKLTDRIIDESEKLAGLDREAAYYEELTRSVKGMGTRASGSEALASLVRTRAAEAFDGIRVGVNQLMDIYNELSAQNLNPSTILYTITAPYSDRTERPLSARSIALYGVFVMMVSALVIAIGCLIHHAFGRRAPRAGGEPAATV